MPGEVDRKANTLRDTASSQTVMPAPVNRLRTRTICRTVTLAWVLAAVILSGPARAEEPPRAVYAHYMLCCPALGDSTESFQKEIRLARQHGIDGFALNAGGWSKEPHYRQRAERMFAAAAREAPDFRLFLSADLCCGLTDADLRDMVTRFADHPNQLKARGRVVLSTFGGEGKADWNKAVLEPLERRGAGVFFVPFFYPPGYPEVPGPDDIGRLHLKHGDLLEGIFFFGAAGRPEALAAAIEAHGRQAGKADRLFMAGVSPGYSSHKTSNNRAFDGQGGEGLHAQWQAVRENGARWVELVTWNDGGEGTHFGPAGEGPDHNAYLRLNAYYANWFKQGKQPAIMQDEVFWFYRPHLRKAEAANEGPGRPAGWRAFEDRVYISLLLHADAEVVFENAGRRQVLPVKAGLRHVSFPMQAGELRIRLERTGRPLADSGPLAPVVTRPARYDFTYRSGYAAASAEKQTAPRDEHQDIPGDAKRSRSPANAPSPAKAKRNGETAAPPPR